MAASMTRLSTPKTTKQYCQETKSAITPPTDGARMGAMVIMTVYQLRRLARLSLLEMPAIQSCIVSMMVARETASMI